MFLFVFLGIVLFTESPREVPIRFVTNSKYSGKGFHASYTQLPCPDTSDALPPQSRPQPSPDSPQLLPQPVQSLPPLLSAELPNQNFNGPSVNPFGTSNSQAITVLDSGPSLGDNGTPVRVPCDLVVYEMNFEIISPGYPNGYPANAVR